MQRICVSRLITLGLLACSTLVAAQPARPPHHREGGFQNNWIEFAPRGLGELISWKWAALRQGLPPPPREPVPVVAPDLAFLSANAKAGGAMDPSVTWIGHATALLQLGGLNVLTDPIFSERASPVSFAGPRRAQPPGLALAQLPRIDLVVISHNHYDHCDLPSLRALAAQPGGPPLILVPLGLKRWLTEEGITAVEEMDWWERRRLGALEVVMTPVQHWSGRTLNDRMQTLWGGWALLAPEQRVFFAGDTGYSRDFADIGQRLGGGGFDLALIPIGAYEPRWFMTDQHVNPPEALRMHRDLRARRSLGIHWGTFELTDEPLDEPPAALARARREAGINDDDFFVLAIGQTRRLPKRAAAQ
jgi:N-acyl-phosphatidylethanolamine-hydrolysing phospholipase D